MTVEDCFRVENLFPRWRVVINPDFESWSIEVTARTAGDACSMAGRLYRAERGAQTSIERIEARRISRRTTA